jgi:predicted nicotinamide N-methyase
MTYPNTLTHFQNGLSLYIPIEKEVKLIYDEMLTVNDWTPFPFWAKLWPASIALTNFLQSNPQWVENKKILEIGAGIGLPSFSIASLAKEVIISDHANDAVALMQKNIEHLNLKNTTSACLDWNHFPDEIKADTILLSDVNYAPEQFDALIKLLTRFLNNGSTLILTTPHRIMGIPFIEKLKQFIQHQSNNQVIEKNQITDISVFVFEK